MKNIEEFKKMISEAKWNGKIYGSERNGYQVYLDGEKVDVSPEIIKEYKEYEEIKDKSNNDWENKYNLWIEDYKKLEGKHEKGFFIIKILGEVQYAILYGISSLDIRGEIIENIKIARKELILNDFSSEIFFNIIEKLKKISGK
ncbi:MAG: hypothetical protein OQK32_01800 [Gammaproteobacteria bacterium]|nr:hypothetical protein [Gammaproteobacteria bacterium]